MTVDDALPVLGPAPERLSLLAKVATMYHDQGLRQPQIATRLHISQSRVSRLLKEAVATGIVRTIVVPPVGAYPELEEEVRSLYGLKDVVVTDVSSEEPRVLLMALGNAGAAYLEATLTGDDVVGISSWSATLLATVDAMRPRTTRAAREIVQVIGGVGLPGVQVQATRLTDQLARRTGAVPRYLPTPGLAPNALVRDALLHDPGTAELQEAWSRLSVLVAGLGSLAPSPLLKSSGNAISDDDMERLRALGAVGDMCLRFFDERGDFVDSQLDGRVVGIGTERLRAVPRRVGLAGGATKYEAVRAAAKGGWINVLITDRSTAERLVKDGTASYGRVRSGSSD